MWPPAEVNKVTLFVKGHLIILYLLYQLNLVCFPPLFENLYRLILWQYESSEGVVLLNNLLHPLFYLLKVFRCKTPLRVKVVIETVLDSRPNGNLHIWKQVFYRMCHHMGCAMPVEFKPLGGVKGNRLHLSIFRECYQLRDVKQPPIVPYCNRTCLPEPLFGLLWCQLAFPIRYNYLNNSSLFSKG